MYLNESVKPAWILTRFFILFYLFIYLFCQEKKLRRICKKAVLETSLSTSSKLV